MQPRCRLRLVAVARHVAAQQPEPEPEPEQPEPERLASRARRQAFPELFTEVGARAVLALASEFGAYHLHSEGATLSIGYGAGEATVGPTPPVEHMVLDEDGKSWIYPHRYDSILNTERHAQRFGDIYGRPEADIPPHSNYYRETYSFGGPGGLQHYTPRAADVAALYEDTVGPAAARLFEGRPLTEISVLYGNLLLPGQEILLHDDVPEFRGLSRKQIPSWLLCVMHHSDLFESHRVRSATCVSYFQPPTSRPKAQGGQLSCYHGGPQVAGTVYEPGHNYAILLDTDSCFHAVAACRPPPSDHRPLPPTMPPKTVLRPADATDPFGEWLAVCGQEVAYRCGYEQLRLSISCKFQCWADEEERRKYHEREDVLTLEGVIATLRADLARRGVDEAALSALELPRVLIETHLLEAEFPTRAAVLATSGQDTKV